MIYLQGPSAAVVVAVAAAVVAVEASFGRMEHSLSAADPSFVDALTESDVLDIDE